MKTNLLSVLSQDGHHNKIMHYPQEDPSAPAMVCFPAMGVRAEWYHPLAQRMVQRGWQVFTVDLRGHGYSSERVTATSSFGYHEMVEFDWPATINTIKNTVPQAPIYLLGHSLGGQLSCLYISRNPGMVAGLILVASCSVYFGGWPFPQNLKVLAGTQLLKAISATLGYLPGKSVGFASTESRTVIRDWANQGRTGRYLLHHSPHDYESLLPEVQLPVLAVSFEHDDLAPKGAVKHLTDKMPKITLTSFHLTQKGGYPKLHHLKWVHVSDPVLDLVQTWLQDKV